jgi:hypothetical protein
VEASAALKFHSETQQKCEQKSGVDNKYIEESQDEGLFHPLDIGFH